MVPPARKQRRSGKEAPVAVTPEVVSTQHINELPNEILSAIVSLLPIDDAVRTTAVSRRWKTIWPSTWLNLNDCDLPCRNDDDLVDVITTILSTHPGPTRRLSLTNLPRVFSTHDDDIFDSWFQSPVLDSIQELRFSYAYKYSDDVTDLLPPSALRFTNLCIASYGQCHFPENLAGVSFPNLRQLTLYELTNSESTLHDMILVCPVIKTLLLSDNKGFRHVRVRSQSLLSLGLSVRNDEAVMEELTIVDAPCMERLLFFHTEGGPANMCVMHAPKLVVLGSLSTSMLQIQVGNTILQLFQNMIATSAVHSMHTVKILAVSAGDFKLNIADILKCFPCLEKLYFTSMVGNFGETIMANIGDMPIQCLDTNLKKIVLRSYRGSRQDVKFATFLIRSARVLRLMEFRVPIRQDTKNWEANERRKLPRVKDRASPAARFRYVYDSRIFRNYEHTNSTHELLESDPFHGML